MEKTQKTMRNARLFKGFTLVELIVVITILAILATIGFLALSGYSQDAKDSAIKANLRSIQTAIAGESAITNNSPRYYVVYDSGYALTGALVYVDGVGVALTGGNWNDPDTNYTAGLPDYVKLKLNPEKFKLSSVGLPGGAFGTVTRAVGFGAEEALAVNDGKSISVWAVSVQSPVVNWRVRSASFFQVVGVTPAGLASVSGNYPASSGSVSGLVKSAWAMVPLQDGVSAGSAPTASILSISGDDAAGRKWSDGTYALSCLGYLNPPAGKTYAGATGNGVYWIDADGSGAAAAFKVQCDMTADGGGWTFAVGDASAISAGKYSITYGDGSYPSMTCSAVAVSTQVVMYSGVFASNCSPYNMTAADLTCVNTNIGLGTANILKWAYYGNYGNTCVSVGDRCPGTSKSHTITWRCR